MRRYYDPNREDDYQPKTPPWHPAFSMLATEEMVAAQIQAGLDPVRLSIQKWEALAHALDVLHAEVSAERYYRGLEIFIGARTCALCLTAIQKYEAERGPQRVNTDKCSVCPLARVDQCTAAGSVFANIEMLLAEDQPARAQLSALIGQMIENLRSIRPGASGEK
jgi:hypothetical protein